MLANMIESLRPAREPLAAVPAPTWSLITRCVDLRHHIVSEGDIVYGDGVFSEVILSSEGSGFFVQFSQAV